MATAYNRLRDYSGAIWTYGQLIELRPDNAITYNNRGVAQSELSYDVMAIPDFSKAIELEPDFALAYYNRGIAYQRMSVTEEANSDFWQACYWDKKYC